MKHVVGELIRWITEYDDHIVRDAGTGIVLGSSEFSYEDHQYTTYVVYRNGIGDKITLSDRNIFKLKTKEK
jgi:hypothetical protein|tara:strand:- start:2479 stop:2691 length:213 start_codon:yes stop_codon:yes gene_type:complete